MVQNNQEYNMKNYKIDTYLREMRNNFKMNHSSEIIRKNEQ